MDSGEIDPMLLRAPAIMPAAPGLIGDLTESNITYVLSTSGSMYNKIALARAHLIRHLQQRSQVPGVMFNVIEFSSEVKQWADKQVQCTSETVPLATEWLQKLQPTTGVNILHALLAAFQDAACEAVCIIADSLPDQHSFDVLDQACYASRGRPVHCVYLAESTPNEEVSAFFRELAEETYGSYRIARLDTAGVLQQVTNVCSNEQGAQRIIHTQEGTIHSNRRMNEVTTGLGVDPRISPCGVPCDAAGCSNYPLGPPWWGWWGWWHPGPLNLPWRRYRPTPEFLRTQQALVSAAASKEVSPSAGSLLLQRDVLARRNADGLFYKGSVKSQVLDFRFLVEFGPNPRGKFSETEYQETPVYNIVALNDALRHSVGKGDHVLAPWKPGGEAYGPGVVISGAESRLKNENNTEEPVTVTFFNGVTRTLPFNTAVWVPQPLYDRASLELQMPESARTALQNATENYPEVTPAGYRSSGPVRYPAYYPNPPMLGQSMPPLGYSYDYIRPKSAVSSVKSDELIPGTSLTANQLSEKVSSQLSMTSLADEKLKARSSAALKLNRSVEFNDQVEVQEAPAVGDTSADVQTREQSELTAADSGFSGSDPEPLEDLSDEELDWEPIDEELHKTSVEKLLQRRNKRRQQKARPPWRKYWPADPVPDVIDPPTWEPYEGGREPVALENRGYKMGPYGLEWTSGCTGVVDTFASYKFDKYEGPTFEPPPGIDGRGPNYRITENCDPGPNEMRQKARDDYRRHQDARRSQAWKENVAQQENMQLTMQDYQRGLVAERNDRDRQKREMQYQLAQQRAEAKQQICAQHRSFQADRTSLEHEREALKMERSRAAQQRRIEKEALREQAAVDREKNNLRRHAAAHNRRHELIHARLVEAERQEGAARSSAATAHAARSAHFRKLEENQQRRKDFDSHANNMRSAMFDSIYKP